MNWQNALDRFVFDNDQIIDEFIDAKRCFDGFAIVDNWYSYFRQYFVPTFSHFMSVTDLIRGFKQTRAKCLVNFDCGIDNICCNCFNIYVVHIQAPFRINFELS